MPIMFDHIELFVNEKVRPNPNDIFSGRCENSTMPNSIKYEFVSSPDDFDASAPKPDHYMKAWRRAARPKVNQDQVAEILGVAKSMVSEYENYESNISLKGLRKVADFLGLPLGYLAEYHPSQVQPDVMEAWANVDPQDRPRALEAVRLFAVKK